MPTSPTDPNASTAFKDPDASAAHRIFNSAGLRVIINRKDPTRTVRVYAPSAANVENSTETVPTGSNVAASQNITDQIAAAITVDTTGTI